MMYFSTKQLAVGCPLSLSYPLLKSIVRAKEDSSHTAEDGAASSFPVHYLLCPQRSDAEEENIVSCFDYISDVSSESDDVEVFMEATAAGEELFTWLRLIGEGGNGTVSLVQSRLLPTRFFAAKTVTKLFYANWHIPTVETALRRSLLGEVKVPTMKQIPFYGSTPPTLEMVMGFQDKDTVVYDHAASSFLREISTAMALPPHPHIARYVGIILLVPPLFPQSHTNAPRTLLEPAAYLLMELGAGGTFASLCARRDGDIAEEHLVCWLCQLLCGLDCLHNAGIIHRDVKPTNILVRRPTAHPEAAWSSETALFLADFGVSAQAGNPFGHSERTVVGTGGYCAPELARYWGQRSRCPYSSSADVWSLGAVFYVLLTCGPEALGSGMHAVMRRMSETTVSLKEEEIGAGETVALIGVSRGDYPSLAFLRDLPLDDHEKMRTSDNVTGAKNDRAERGEATLKKGTWSSLAFSRSVQWMARRVQEFELSDAFVQVIDAMMSVDPAKRPKAGELLHASPLFGVRLPWWEAATAAAAHRIADARAGEDVLLDVCNGDSDEEEEEAAAEAALLRRGMSPLVSPKKNGYYVPHSVLNWCVLDLTLKDQSSAASGPAPGSFLRELVRRLARLRGIRTDESGHTRLCAVHEVRCVERVLVPLNSANALTRDKAEGPIQHELEARGLESRFFIHMQLRVQTRPLARTFILPDVTRPRSIPAEFGDTADRTQLTMENVVATTHDWLVRRHDGAREPHAALSVLPWVAWHHQHDFLFTVEYIAAAPKRAEGVWSPFPVSADTSALLREWRARLREVQLGLRRAAAQTREAHHADPADAVLANGTPTEPRIGETCGSRGVCRSLRRAFGRVDAAERALRAGQSAQSGAEAIAHWICVRPIPTTEECVRVMCNRGGKGAQTLPELVSEWFADAFRLTECAAVTMAESDVFAAKPLRLGATL